MQIVTVFVCEEGDCKTEMTETARSTNSVKIGLCGPGEVKVNDDVDSLNIDTSSEEI